MLKKLIMLALVLALTVCVLVACGGETETGAPETNAPETNAPETEPQETEHVHDLEVEEVAATCQARGYHKETCKTCGEVVVENAYPKTACTPVAAATCTEDSVCSACGEVIEQAIDTTPDLPAGLAEAVGKEKYFVGISSDDAELRLFLENL